MRKLSSGLFMSIDGVVESPDRWGFQYFNEEMSAGIAGAVAKADTILMGRRTYVEFAKIWPSQGNDTPMAAFLNNAPKYVLSRTLTHLEWANSILLTGDLKEEVTKLKQQPGKNIQLPGSPYLVRSLIREGLLDELNLNICPIVVGAGMRLFEDMSDQIPLRLANSTTLSTGVIGVTYEPAKN